jgi:glycosyltransferase involved in cell wall biosynthesis
MKTQHGPKILFVSTFPPRECGIATFCQDMFSALKEQFDETYKFEICALHEGNFEQDFYPPEVTYTLNTLDLDSYFKVANDINQDKNIEAIVVQHEFGLYGGEYGSDLLTFLFSVDKPVSIIFHTVLPGPNPQLKEVVIRILDLVVSVIVMTENSAFLLHEFYGVDFSKIKVIPHGTHAVSWDDQNLLKKKYGLDNKMVLTTFGLISSNKNIETALKALPEITYEFPSVVYLIIGKTHPKVIEKEGERYRESLEVLIKELNLEDHVIFVNRYLSLPELLEYLKLSDLYLFTSKDPNQAVSGTFSYALSCACPIISTPIAHAKEILKSDIGAFFDFYDYKGLSREVKEILKVPDRLKEKALNAFRLSQPTIWQNVAISVLQEINKISETMVPIYFKKPETNFSHLNRMTTDIGIIQFSKINVPDYDSGYTIDDNARALIASVMKFKEKPSDELLSYIETYLDFITYCQLENGEFMNYVDKKGVFHEQNHYVNLEDSNARAIWALGFLLANGKVLPQNIVKRADATFMKSLPMIPEVNSPRSIAFIIKGLYYLYQYKPSSSYKLLVTILADKLVNLYKISSEDSWNWFEDYLTYANGVMPEALIMAFDLTNSPAFRDVALKSFNFLLSQTFEKDQIKVVSNRGWKLKGIQKKENFGEQPIDVAYTILALNSFYQILDIDRYRDYMEVAYSWFLGNNHLNQIMYDPISGAGYDGLEKHNINLNQGAESSICFLISSMVLRKQKFERNEDLVTQRRGLNRPYISINKLDKEKIKNS